MAVRLDVRIENRGATITAPRFVLARRSPGFLGTDRLYLRDRMNLMERSPRIALVGAWGCLLLRHKIHRHAPLPVGWWGIV
jgi:hypothetical protein